jgi:hypothetical protein
MLSCSLISSNYPTNRDTEYVRHYEAHMAGCPRPPAFTDKDVHILESHLTTKEPTAYVDIEAVEEHHQDTYPHQSDMERCFYMSIHFFRLSELSLLSQHFSTTSFYNVNFHMCYNDHFLISR